MDALLSHQTAASVVESSTTNLSAGERPVCGEVTTASPPPFATRPSPFRTAASQSAASDVFQRTRSPVRHRSASDPSAGLSFKFVFTGPSLSLGPIESSGASSKINLPYVNSSGKAGLQRIILGAYEWRGVNKLSRSSQRDKTPVPNRSVPRENSAVFQRLALSNCGRSMVMICPKPAT